MAATKKSIAARMHENCKGFTTVCTLSAEDTREAVDALIALQVRLQELTDQITATAPRDELGHDFRLNDAHIRAVELLHRLGNVLIY
jgi:hypothetical protein